MATLEKIRTRAGLFITIIIGIALLSFLVNPQDIIQYFQSSKNVVGEINGKKVDYQDFVKMADQYTPVVNMQYAMQGIQVPQDELSKTTRDQVWNKMLREYYLDGQFDKVGLGVSEKELGDLATVNLSPIMELFPQFVHPQTKQVNRENIQLFWQNPNRDQQTQNFINFLEDEIKNYALTTKYISLITKASYVNSLEVKRAKENLANSAEFNYIVQRYMAGAEADSLYKIKESEAKDYYNKYKKRFEQAESRDIEMVVFPINPTQEDYDFTKNKIENIIPLFKTATDLPQFVNTNSDKRVERPDVPKFDYAYYKQSELPSNVEEFAFTANKQDIFGPYLDGSSYKIARIQDERMVPDSIYIRKMMLQITSQEELTQADSIIKLLSNGANWAEIARAYSADSQDVMTGGDVGWLLHSQVPHPLLDSCILNPTGKVISIPTQEGYYVFQASQKSKESKMVRLAIVQKDVIPGKKTDAAAYDRAIQLSSSSQGGYDAFRKAVEEGGYTAQVAPNIIRGSKQVLAMDNAQAIVEWVYKETTEKNSISHPLNVNQQYYVIAVATEIREDGVSPFDQVKYSIGEELKKEKQAVAMATKMKEAATSASNLEDLAAKLNLDVLQVTNPVTFGSVFSYSSYIPGLGLEPKVTAAATTITELNKISEPIAGNAGVYVISITNKRTDEGYTEDMAKQTLSRENTMRQESWYSTLLEAGKVKDSRAKFF